MKTTTALITLTSTLLATAAPTARDTTTYKISVLSSHSASPIHLLSLTAINGSLILTTTPPTTYCPLTDKSACPPGTATVLTINNSTGTLAMDVEVPGGQQVYVRPDGTLGYTTAHSATVPAGAVRRGFSYTAPVTEGGVGILNFNFKGTTAQGEAEGFMACPLAEGECGYSVIVAQKGVDPEGKCLGFGATTGIWEGGAAAWQYAG